MFLETNAKNDLPLQKDYLKCASMQKKKKEIILIILYLV